MITSKCDAVHTIDFDTITCDLPKGHEGMHKDKFFSYHILWSIEYD